MTDFDRHPGFRRLFAPDRLTVGLFLPLRQYEGDIAVLHRNLATVTRAEQLGFAAVWARDVPLHDPSFGDVGQIFDLWTTLAYLAARTERIALAAGSAIFTLRHPIDLAKAAASIDVLSGGRLVLGIASGDRPAEFPAYGVDFETRAERFRETVATVRALAAATPTIDSPLGRLNGADLLPKPVAGGVPLLVTGSSRQSPAWIAEHADGWLSYPGVAATAEGRRDLARRVAAWRERIPEGRFKPHATNEWIELAEDPDLPPTPLRGGFVLRIGSRPLVELLEDWRAGGVNHVALGIQHGRRPVDEALAELGEAVLPHFPPLDGPEPHFQEW